MIMLKVRLFMIVLYHSRLDACRHTSLPTTHKIKSDTRTEVCLHPLHLPAPDIMLAEVQTVHETVQIALDSLHPPPAPPAPPLHPPSTPCTAPAPPLHPLHLSKHPVLHFLHPTPQYTKGIVENVRVLTARTKRKQNMM